MLKSKKLNLIIGIAISALFLYLAFRNVEIAEMGKALRKANYWYLIPATVFLFFSLWFRAYRWGIFFKPIKPMKLNNLFSALMVGYMANTVFPFKLGEFLRAYSIGKVENFSKVASLATIVVERILDVITLLILFGIALVFQPFDDSLKSAGLILFLVAMAAILFLVFLVVKTEATLTFYNKLTAIFPATLREKGESILKSLLEGLLVLKKPEYYAMTVLTSIAIWACYIAIVVIFIFSFEMNSEIFANNIGTIVLASITILVMTGISVSVPSSPGYVGTYHFLVMQGLAIYSVPTSEAFSFAAVMHIFSMAPPALMGIYYFLKQHISIQEALENEGALEEALRQE